MNWFRGNLMPPIQTDVMTQNVILGLSVLSPWRYVFISQKAYQESETRPESSVYTLMKGTAVHGDDILDTVEYARPSEVSAERTLQHRQGCFTFLTLTAAGFFAAFPSQGGDVISTILRREVTYDQSQGTCAEVRGHQKLCRPVNTRFLSRLNICFISLQHFNVANANCTKDSDCVQGEVDFDGHGTVFYSSQSLSSSLFGLYFITHLFSTLFFCRQKNGQMRSVLQPHLQNLWDPKLVSYWGVRCSSVR